VVTVLVVRHLMGSFHPQNKKFSWPLYSHPPSEKATGTYIIWNKFVPLQGIKSEVMDKIEIKHNVRTNAIFLKVSLIFVLQ